MNLPIISPKRDAKRYRMRDQRADGSGVYRYPSIKESEQWNDEEIHRVVQSMSQPLQRRLRLIDATLQGVQHPSQAFGFQKSCSRRR